MLSDSISTPCEVGNIENYFSAVLQRVLRCYKMLKSSMTLSITIHQQDLTILTKCVSLGSLKPGLTIMQYTHTDFCLPGLTD